MKCSECGELPKFKCKCPNIYLCADHLGNHISKFTVSHEIEPMSLRLDDEKLKNIRSNALKNIESIKKAKGDINYFANSLQEAIEKFKNNSLEKLEFIENENQHFLEYDQFSVAEQPKIEKYESNELIPRYFNEGPIISEISKFFDQDPVFFKSQSKAKSQRFLSTNSSIISCSLISSDSRKFITGGKDKTIRIWDRESSKQEYLLLAHNSAVNCLELTPDNGYLISGSDDRRIKIWKFNSMSKVGVLKGHTSKVTCVKYIEKGKLIVSGGLDLYILFWDFEKHNIVKKIEIKQRIYCIHLMKNNSEIIFGSKKYYKILNPESNWTILESKYWHLGPVYCLSVTNNEKMIASGSIKGDIIISKRKPLKKKPLIKLFQLSINIGKVRFLSFLNDQISLLSATETYIYLFKKEESPGIEIEKDDNDKIISMITYNKEIYFFSSNLKVLKFDYQKKEAKQFLKFKMTELDFLRFSSHTEMILYGNKNGIYIYDNDQEKVFFELIQENIQNHFFEISSSKKYVFYSCISDNQISLLNSQTKEQIALLNGHSSKVICAEISDDEMKCVSGSEDNKIIVWNLRLNCIIDTFIHHKSLILSIKFISNTDLIASAEKNKIFVWDSRNMDVVFQSKEKTKIHIIDTIILDDEYVVFCDNLLGIHLFNIKNKQIKLCLQNEKNVWRYLKKNKYLSRQLKKYIHK